jgi:CDP-glucose 4,6-dehydratase
VEIWPCALENLVTDMFDNAYFGKKVLVTGHTGFKGSWLTAWLLLLGANVVGYSKDIPTKPSMFTDLRLDQKIDHHFGDIRDLPQLKSLIKSERPDFVFHLAAQAIVSTSYVDPLETISSNTLGSANVMEALREVDHPCVAVMITSDKCYDNVEWVWGYRETDAMGGKDVYSGSKGAAELLINCYMHSFFMKDECPVRIGIGRAGNVIGGGDWAKDRLVVDIVKAWNQGKPVEIRSPQATRPWQHVLEPLSGYLTLGVELSKNLGIRGNAFNFGPRAEQNRTVVELMDDLSRSWEFKTPQEAYQITDNIPFHEAGLLKLNCDKALFHLKWEANLHYVETVKFIAEWYSAYYKGDLNMLELTNQQLIAYEKLAKERGRVWTQP